MDTLRKKSLHFRLAHTYARFEVPANWDMNEGKWVETPTDFCSYARAVIAGIVIALCITLIGGIFASITIGDFIAWVSILITRGYFVEPEPGALITMIVSIIGTALYLFHKFMINIYKPWKEARRDRLAQEPIVIKEPTFLGTWYKSIKEKACFSIKFTE